MGSQTFPSPGDLPDSGIKPTSPEAPALQADFLSLSHQGSPDLFIFFSWPFHVTCGILVPQPGIEPGVENVPGTK